MTNSSHRPSRAAGFSLIELVIVVVIIGIIAAIAIPRLSRGSAGAADSAVSGNLAVLRTAIDLYQTEHSGSYPGSGTFDATLAQLTMYTDISGTTSATKTATAIYGPYLRKVPPLPVGPTGYKGTITAVDGSSGTPGTAAGAWFYNATTGDIRANLVDAQQDVSGKSYNAY